MKDCSRTDVSKNVLHKWLSTTPDELQIPGYAISRRQESNSICHLTTSALKGEELSQLTYPR